MRASRFALLIFAFSMSGAAAHSEPDATFIEGLLSRPVGEDCTLDLAVQTKACRVSHFYRCTSDPEGQYRLLNFDRDGLRSITMADSEGRMISFVSPRFGSIIVPIDPLERQSSFSELAETGRSSGDFKTVGFDGSTTRWRTQEVLKGTATIDGFSMDVREYEATIEDDGSEGPNWRFDAKSTAYFDLETGYDFGEYYTSTDEDGKTEITDSTPVRVLQPGDEGFGDVMPEFGCDDPLS